MRPLPITVTAKFFSLFFSTALFLKPPLVQWKDVASAAVAPTLTCHQTIVKKNSWLLSREGIYRLGNGKFAIGLENKMVRFLRNKNKCHNCIETKLTVAPVLFLAMYEANQGKKLHPYVAAGRVTL